MAKEVLTDEQVEAEILRLQNSQAVKLGEKEMHLKNKRRQYMYQLRCYEKRGQQLIKDGITMDNIQSRLFSDIEDIEM